MGAGSVLKGSDVSAYQSEETPPGDFVIIKLTEGTGYLNSKADKQLASARRKGQLVGFYHFPHYSNDPADDWAAFKKALAGRYRAGDNIVLDHEAGKDPGVIKAANWAVLFCAKAERDGYRPWVYSNRSWALDGHCRGLSKYPHWLAQPDGTTNEPTSPFDRLVAKQYSWTPYDKDVFYGSVEDWKKLSTTLVMIGDEMPETNGHLRMDGDDGRHPILFKTGTRKQIGFFLDNTFKDDTHQEVPPQKLRVAVGHADGTWETTTVSVGKTEKGTTPWVYVKFKNGGKDVRAVSVSRLDSGTGTIAFMVD